LPRLVIFNQGIGMKKVQKMAEGGIPALGDLLGEIGEGGGRASPMPMPGNPGGGGGGGSASDGLGTVNQGAQAIGSALGRASEAIGGGGGGGGGGGSKAIMPYYKKGGKVTTTRRVSTGSASKKSPNW